MKFMSRHDKRKIKLLEATDEATFDGFDSDFVLLAVLTLDSEFRGPPPRDTTEETVLTG